jgi:signal peptide peptidase SppA
MDALRFVTSVPWMILPDYLELIEQAAAREGTPEEIAARIEQAREKREERENSPVALAAKKGEKLEGSRRVSLRGNVAILPIEGPIFRHASLFNEISGATSTEMLAYDFHRALASEQVGSVVLAINSPGGEVFGIAEFAQMIAERASDKRVIAYIDGYGASAAYYIASAADEVVIESSALVGSIGTVMESTDYSKAYEARGVKKHTYVSMQSPRKRPKMGTESGDAQIQKIVDDLGQIFVEDVARYRGVTPEKVLNDFGQGGLLVGKAAVTAGLADRIGSFESLLSEMAAGNKHRTRRVAVTSNTESTQPEPGAHGGGKVSLKDKFFAWLDSQESPSGKDEGQPVTLTLQSSETQPAKVEESEAYKKIVAENAALKEAKFKAEAEGFIHPLIKAGSVLPAVKDGFVRDYVRAALDDEARPVAQGEPSRVDALKGRYESGKSHGLTMQFVKTKSELSAGALVLADSDDPDAAILAQEAAEAKAYAERANGNRKAS